MERLLPPSRGADTDAGGIVIGWLVKIVVVVGLLGVALFDAISIGVSRLSVEDAGTLAAREASTALARNANLQAAYETAVYAALEANPLNEVPPSSFVALPDGSVELVVTREATTFVVQHIQWIAPWAHVEARATGKPLP
jgi:hypothetical protein